MTELKEVHGALRTVAGILGQVLYIDLKTSKRSTATKTSTLRRSWDGDVPIVLHVVL